MNISLLVLAVFAAMAAVSVTLHLLPALAARARQAWHQAGYRRQHPAGPDPLWTAGSSTANGAASGPAWPSAEPDFAPAPRPGQPRPAWLAQPPSHRPGVPPRLNLPPRAGGWPDGTGSEGRQ